MHTALDARTLAIVATLALLSRVGVPLHELALSFVALRFALGARGANNLPRLPLG